jgi:hypothetical protein
MRFDEVSGAVRSNEILRIREILGRFSCEGVRQNLHPMQSDEVAPRPARVVTYDRRLPARAFENIVSRRQHMIIIS